MTDSTDVPTTGGHDPEPALPEGRYGLMEMSMDQVIVYDRELPSAWIQTDSAVDLQA